MVTRGVVTAARTSNCAVFAYSPLPAVARLGCGTSNYVVILLVVTRGVVAAATRITALFSHTRHYSPRLRLAVLHPAAPEHTARGEAFTKSRPSAVTNVMYGTHVSL